LAGRRRAADLDQRAADEHAGTTFAAMAPAATRVAVSRAERGRAAPVADAVLRLVGESAWPGGYRVLISS
jgi:hypothetical protein